MIPTHRVEGNPHSGSLFLLARGNNFFTLVETTGTTNTMWENWMFTIFAKLELLRGNAMVASTHATAGF
jgi:hypothetical protein